MFLFQIPELYQFGRKQFVKNLGVGAFAQGIENGFRGAVGKKAQVAEMERQLRRQHDADFGNDDVSAGRAFRRSREHFFDFAGQFFVFKAVFNPVEQFPRAYEFVCFLRRRTDGDGKIAGRVEFSPLKEMVRLGRSVVPLLV